MTTPWRSVQDAEKANETVAWQALPCRMVGNHQLKFGIDFRRLNPEEKPNTYQQAFFFDALTDVLANSATQVNVNSATPDVQLVTSNVFSLKIHGNFRNLTAIYGIRWEYNTAA
jgi:hypothetical protein